MSRRNPTAAIEARQRQDLEVRKYNQAAAENVRQKMISSWESKTSKTVESKELLRNIDSVQSKHDDILVIRRNRLAELLVKEKEEHDDMLANLGESDEQRRERLMQKARDLRTQREELRQTDANVKRDQLFRQNEIVRQAESKIKILYTADQRHEQLIQLAQRREEDKAEEEYFNQLGGEALRRQNARARADLEATHTRAIQTQKDLAIQCDANQRRSSDQRSRQQQEDADFARSVQTEKAASDAKDAARREHVKQLGVEIKQRNEELLRIKKSEYDQLRGEDKQALDQLLARIAEDERLETERKKHHRELAMEHMKKVELQMNAQAETETAIDKLWQQENDKEWEKREARWMEEQNIREALLRHVHETRKNQIRASFGKMEQDGAAKKRDYDNLVAQVEALKAKDEIENAQRRQAMNANQQQVLAQMQRKAEIKEAERSGKRNELTDAQSSELAYKDKLEAELQRLDAGKPERYRNVPLIQKSNKLY